MRRSNPNPNCRPSEARRLDARRHPVVAFIVLLWIVWLAAWTTTPAQESAGGAASDARRNSLPPDVATEARAWGAIVYAGPEDIQGLESAKGTDGDDPAVAARTRLFEGVEAKLEKSFPAERHILLAEHTQKIFKEYESWVVPSKELFLKIDSRGPAPGGGTKLGVQVWQGEKVLAKADAVLTTDKPLFIGGPKWRGGRLILVVVLF